jgi:uncharacterized PurR-regulated membrane protein YhhQ (DUF165 family)
MMVAEQTPTMPARRAVRHAEAFSREKGNPPRLIGFCALLAYVSTILTANLTLSLVGVIRLWPSHLLAPAGVLWVGVALSARDLVQETLGRRWTIIAIPIGAALSALLSPALAVASGTAFLLSESFDMLCFTPLRVRGR